MQPVLGSNVGRGWPWIVVALSVLLGVDFLRLPATLVRAAPLDAVITDCSNDGQLRAALMAVGPSTITFDCGAGSQVIPISAFMEVGGTVTVEGAGVITLDGGASAALLQVLASGNLTLHNLTLARGAFNGAHPIENFGRLTLVNVEVRNHRSTGTGGAIFNQPNATLTVRDSRFIDNTGTVAATTFGGAIHSEGLAFVQDSTFRTNSVVSNGGAIAVYGGHFSITRTRFSENEALDGGALYVAPGTVVTVTQSVFADNDAGYGGAIESLGELQVDYSTFAKNRATTGDGGAVWVLGSDLDVTYSTFAENEAATTGGAISCYGDNVSIIHATLNANQAGTLGGGLYSACNVNFTNSTVDANTATTSGGGIHIAGSAFAAVAHLTLTRNNSLVGAGVYNDSPGSSTLTLQAVLLAENGSANCDGLLTSNGDNMSSDTTCGVFVQPGDRQAVALPMGALLLQSGPTATRIPLRGNPAINAIPAARCGFATDQRDVARPKRGACDVGAVEVFYSTYFPHLRR